MQKIILASGSPRRKEILELLGINFDVVDSKYDETQVKFSDSIEMVEELAIQKALAVANKYTDAIIIGGDTTVDLNGEILGKAENKSEARKMFAKLLSNTHKVVTGVAIVNSLTGETYVGSEEGVVSFRSGSQIELEMYVENEKNWRGFAGAYAIQGGAQPFVVSWSGKLSAIIGLPIELTVYLLEQAGVNVDANPVFLEHELDSLKVGIPD